MDNNDNSGYMDIYKAFVEYADSITIVSEPGALAFITRKKWRELPEKSFGELIKHTIENVFLGTHSLFLLLKNPKPFNYHTEPADSYCLIRIEMDEEGKLILHTMDLSNAEEYQLEQNQATLWE